MGERVAHSTYILKPKRLGSVNTFYNFVLSFKYTSEAEGMQTRV